MQPRKTYNIFSQIDLNKKTPKPSLPARKGQSRWFCPLTIYQIRPWGGWRRKRGELLTPIIPGCEMKSRHEDLDDAATDNVGGKDVQDQHFSLQDLRSRSVIFSSNKKPVLIWIWTMKEKWVFVKLFLYESLDILDGFLEVDNIVQHLILLFFCLRNFWFTDVNFAWENRA